MSHSDAKRYTSGPLNQERQGCQKRRGVISTADRGQGVKDLVDRPEAYIQTWLPVYNVITTVGYSVRISTVTHSVHGNFGTFVTFMTQNAASLSLRL